MHRWFLDEWAAVAEAERSVRGVDPASLDAGEWRRLKRLGIGDGRIETLTGRDQREVRRIRKAAGVRPVFKAVDSCAAEVVARAPYYYSAYEDEDELDRGERESVIILGAGPNRIGQGIEFDYCCVQAAQTLRRLGYDAVMVNCNPETVSTDADSSDRLYFEPLTVEDVLEVIERERPLGVVAQFGGQTPLRLARRLEEEGVPLLGTPFEAIDIAEDRERFGGVLRQLGLEAPAWGIAGDVDDAVRIAGEIGYPVLVRPSYVLGGRAMRICYDEASLRSRPVEPSSLVDRFVEDAIEVDVDAVCDGTRTWIGAVMQHVEEAGVHSGDSACVIPTLSLGEELERQIRAQTAGDRRGAGRPRADQRPVRRAGLADLRDRGQPAGVQDGAVRGQGNRRGDGRGGLPRRARSAGRSRGGLARSRQREGGRAAVQPVLRRRPDPGSGDALDRRGDGHRAGLPDGLRQGRAGRRTAVA